MTVLLNRTGRMYGYAPASGSNVYFIRTFSASASSAFTLTFSSADLSGHTSGHDLFIALSYRNRSIQNIVTAVTVDGESASAVSNTQTRAAAENKVEAAIWRIAGATLSATGDITITWTFDTINTGVSDTCVALYGASSVTTVAGEHVDSGTNPSTTVSVAAGDSVIMVSGVKGNAAGTISLTGVTKDFEEPGAFLTNFYHAGGAENGVAVNASYSLQSTFSAASDHHCLSAVVITP